MYILDAKRLCAKKSHSTLYNYFERTRGVTVGYPIFYSFCPFPIQMQIKDSPSQLHPVLLLELNRTLSLSFERFENDGPFITSGTVPGC